MYLCTLYSQRKFTSTLAPVPMAAPSMLGKEKKAMEAAARKARAAAILKGKIKPSDPNDHKAAARAADIRNRTQGSGIRSACF